MVGYKLQGPHFQIHFSHLSKVLQPLKTVPSAGDQMFRNQNVSGIFYMQNVTGTD